MPSGHFLFVIGARALPPKMAVGSKFASPSAALGTLRAAINDQDSKPIKITPDQWKFLRGVYAMNPEAPCGLPYGDNAVLGPSATSPGRRRSIVRGVPSTSTFEAFFIDISPLLASYPGHQMRHPGALASGPTSI